VPSALSAVRRAFAHRAKRSKPTRKRSIAVLCHWQIDILKVNNEKFSSKVSIEKMEKGRKP